MDKKKAKIIKDEVDKWIVEVEGLERPQWLFKDKANRLPFANQIQIGFEFEVEMFQDDRNRWKMGRMFLLQSNTKNEFQPMRGNNNFEYPTYAKADENFHLRLFKQKGMFNSNYEFDKKYNIEFQKSQFNTVLVSKINQTNINNAKNLLGEDNVICDLVFHPDWRLVIGLGGSSVYETGMTLHHTYGIPYIPASAVKGIVRSYVITEVYKNEIEALSKKDFCDIFGCSGEGKIEDANGKKQPFKSFYKIEAEQNNDKRDSGDRQGKVIFFDAFPIGTIKLEADIMNPHYSDYYGDTKGEVPPADWHNPIPIPFLTIGKTTSFQFVIGVKKENVILNQTKSWLESALKEKGIGAKTAVGYGYMK